MLGKWLRLPKQLSYRPIVSPPHRCLSMRARQSVYSRLPGRESYDLHHSSSESSRCSRPQPASSRADTMVAMQASRDAVSTDANIVTLAQSRRNLTTVVKLVLTPTLAVPSAAKVLSCYGDEGAF